MKKNILYILLLLLSSTAALSCSVNDFIGENSGNGLQFQLYISGFASDLETGEPLEGMQIEVVPFQFGNEAYPKKSVFTNKEGRFAVTFEGYKRPTNILATAIDRDSVYVSGSQEIFISWTESYHIKNGVCYIEGCDFFMKKSENP